LARGEWQVALELLREAETELPKDARIKQDEAAALMVGKEHAQALELLSSVAAQDLTADGKAALEYLRGKA
jgi:Flp pilus assembly protein TadD